ncbi:MULTISPECIES: ABC transporter permease [Sphingobacterium]|uniref:ABC transporter permease n=1 Tax=Sphingobacterium TaxID=28453 RepID=UPI00257E63F1|nr:MULTISPECIES: ABC transporter permease [Sphingobacterium]
MKNVVKGISTEFIKSKNTFVSWLVILGAAFMPLFVSFGFLIKWEQLIPEQGKNPWDDFTEMSWRGMGFLYTPFFVVLLICLFLNIEHKSNTWKHIFTLPISKGTIYFNKLITLLIFIVFFYMLYVPFWVGCGFFVGIIKPALQLTKNTPDYVSMINLCFHSFIASLGIVGIHFWLSLRFKNMIIPIAIAVLGGIIWVALYQGRAEQITYFPYAYNYSTINPPHWVSSKMFGIFPQHEIFSIVYFVMFSILSYRYFKTDFKDN